MVHAPQLRRLVFVVTPDDSTLATEVLEGREVSIDHRDVADDPGGLETTATEDTLLLNVVALRILLRAVTKGCRGASCSRGQVGRRQSRGLHRFEVAAQLLHGSRHQRKWLTTSRSIQIRVRSSYPSR